MHTPTNVKVRPLVTFGGTALALVAFALFFQHFGYLLIILGPLSFIVMILWLISYAPLLLIPMTHYESPDMNFPFLTLSGLTLYSMFVAAFISAALHGNQRVRMIARTLLTVLFVSNAVGAYLLWGAF